ASPILLKVHYADRSEAPTQLQASVAVTGTNSFAVDVKPVTLVAGLAENVKVSVRDSFGAPVEDANLLFFECDGSPLNGQELQIQGDGSLNKGADGVYRARLQTASVGAIGVRVAREGFKTFEACVIEAVAGDFLRVEPETLRIEGDSSEPDKLAKELAVYSSLPVRSRVSTSVKCVERVAVLEREITTPPIYVVPQSFYLKNSAKVQVLVEPNATADAECSIIFRGEVNPKNSFEAVVLAQVKLTRPPVVEYCPLDLGYKCLPTTNIPSNCFPQTKFECKGLKGASPNSLCFVCDYGMHTLPESFELTVGETKPTDSKSSDIALDSKPKCSLEGFEDSPNRLPSSQYSSLYGSIPSNYWDYQPNQWSYPASSLWGSNYQPFNYQNYYGSIYGGYGGVGASGYASGYGTNYGAAYGYGLGSGVTFGTAFGAGYGYGAGGAYGGGYGTGAYGVYCPPNLNTQALYGSYYSSSFQSPWNTGFPAGNPLACQYPYICQSGASAYCSFTAAGYSSSYSLGFSSYGSACSYPAVCFNPSACPYLSGYFSAGYGGYGNYGFNYRDDKPPVSVAISSCTALKLGVTAEYTGNDYFYNGGMGGEQKGFLVVEWKGEEKKIPVKVKVLPASQPRFTRFPQAPIPFPPMMPPYCLPGVAPLEASEGLDEYGFPTDLQLKVNAFTGVGEYERKIEVAPGVLCKQFKSSEGASVTGKCSSGKLYVKATYPESKRKDLSDSITFKALVPGGEPREYSFEVSNDDLVPDGKITLYEDARYWESGEREELEKAKCSVSSNNAGIKASCKKNVLNVSWDGVTAGSATVKIANAADYNLRVIPVEAKKERVNNIANVAATYYKQQQKLVVTGLSNVPSDATDLKIRFFTDAACANAYNTPIAARRDQTDYSVALENANPSTSTLTDYSVAGVAAFYSVPVTELVQAVCRQDGSCTNRFLDAHGAVLANAPQLTPEQIAFFASQRFKNYWFTVTAAKQGKTLASECKQIDVRASEAAATAGAPAGSVVASTAGGSAAASGAASSGELRFSSFNVAVLTPQSFKLSGAFSGSTDKWVVYSIHLLHKEREGSEVEDAAYSDDMSTSATLQLDKSSGTFVASCDPASCPNMFAALRKIAEDLKSGRNYVVFARVKAWDEHENEIASFDSPDFAAKLKQAFLLATVVESNSDKEAVVTFVTGRDFGDEAHGALLTFRDNAGNTKKFLVYPRFHCVESTIGTITVGAFALITPGGAGLISVLPLVGTHHVYLHFKGPHPYSGAELAWDYDCLAGGGAAGVEKELPVLFSSQTISQFFYKKNYACRGTNIVVSAYEYRREATCLQTSSRRVLPCFMLSTCELGRVKMKFTYRG
ncbi:MAG: hypothetical protein QW343_01475, partial [Candidatus Norongarragalinales archaeon]